MQMPISRPARTAKATASRRPIPRRPTQRIPPKRTCESWMTCCAPRVLALDGLLYRDSRARATAGSHGGPIQTADEDFPHRVQGGSVLLVIRSRDAITGPYVQGCKGTPPCAGIAKVERC